MAGGIGFLRGHVSVGEVDESWGQKPGGESHYKGYCWGQSHRVRGMEEACGVDHDGIILSGWGRGWLYA